VPESRGVASRQPSSFEFISLHANVNVWLTNANALACTSRSADALGGSTATLEGVHALTALTYKNQDTTRLR